MRGHRLYARVRNRTDETIHDLTFELNTPRQVLHVYHFRKPLEQGRLPRIYFDIPVVGSIPSVASGDASWFLSACHAHGSK